MEPRWKDTTGGMWLLNKLLACRITPSPPRQATKSTCSAKLQDKTKEYKHVERTAVVSKERQQAC
jgi:hypothetical protein